MASTPPRSVLSRVSLTSKTFEEARQRYLDETKPDPLIRRQIEGLTLQWLDDDNKNAEQHANEIKRIHQQSLPHKDATAAVTTTDDDGDNALAPWKFSHVLSGRLRIQGEHMVCTLHTECWWRQKDAGANSAADALWYQCRASADFVSLVDDQQEGETNASSAAKDVTAAAKRIKIHQQKMIKRLSADDYIAKLRSKSKGNSVPQLLMEAAIRLDQANLEERVQNSQDIAEGIRRAIFSQADTTLDVLELLVNLPCLPTTSSKIGKSSDTQLALQSSSSSSSSSAVAKLADRAKLRLLEDFMCDACEFEGEDELVSELELGGSDEQQQQQQQHKRFKKVVFS